MERYSKEWWREYRSKNGERLREYKRKYDSSRWKTCPEKEKLRKLRWIEKNPEKYKAHKLFHAALSRGDLFRQPCSICGITKVEAHHEDYTKPLEVIWFCALHHRAHDRKRRENATI